MHSGIATAEQPGEPGACDEIAKVLEEAVGALETAFVTETVSFTDNGPKRLPFLAAFGFQRTLRNCRQCQKEPVPR